ncbi:MAG TPA: hypothetical protein PLF61_02900, partial [Candidatus Goldiibacteriota bacterium]|nr:hypothetical protein [Candidatus Goldiibacteriota bacterium]
SGEISFTGFAAGIDEYSGFSVTDTADSKNVYVQQPAPLLSKPSLIAYPSRVSVGQIITVIMGVTNSGLADAENTTAIVYVNAGDALLRTGPMPVTRTISTGSYGTFTWTFSANGAGNLIFTGSAHSLGVDSLNNTSNTVLIQTKPVGTIVFNSLTSPLSVGQVITVVMKVTNNGQADLINVTPDLTKMGDTAGISYISGPVPITATVSGNGGEASFTWKFNIIGNGTVNFYGEAFGYDVNSGIRYDLEPKTSSMVVLQNPASLTSQLFIPSPVSLNQVFTVRMLVSNAGQATAINMAPSALDLSGSIGSAIKLTGPVPATEIIGGGNAKEFTWTYSAVGTGSIDFKGNACGQDQNSGQTICSIQTNRSVIVQKASSLIASINAQPDPAKTGENLTVVMAVSNDTGAATAINVSITPQDMEVITGGSASIDVTLLVPSPSTRNISAGATSYFTWVFKLGNGSGSIAFSARAIGTDANAGWGISTNKVSSNVVEVEASSALSSEIIIPKTVVSVGEIITVLMSVTNDGGAVCNTVNANSLIKTGTGSVVLLSGPAPQNISLVAGASSVFTWTYSADGSGSVWFSGNATGTDPVFGAVTSAVSGSRTINIQNAVNLVSSLIVAPFQVSLGQTITLVMSVTNNGQAQALNVDGILPVKSGSGSVVLLSTPTPVNLPGNTSTLLTWTYTASGTGTVYFTSRAVGTDENSGLTKYSNIATSQNVLIQTPAQ